MTAISAPNQHTQPLERTPAGGEPMRVPAPLDGTRGRVIVDTTWGAIQPIRLHDEIDTRRRESLAGGTIPGARSLPHTEIEQRLEELDPDTPAILFCNGPQCAATPHAIRLLERGHPARMLRYYRGGMHDWVTLGLPTTPADTPGIPKTSRTPNSA